MTRPDVLAEKQLRIPVGLPTPEGFKDLRVDHWSAEVFDSDEQARRDLTKIRDQRHPHMLGGTESGDYKRKAVIHDVLGDRYRVVTVPGSDAWCAVRRSLVHGDWAHSYHEVLPSGREAHDPHHYAAKGILEVSWSHPRLGHLGFVPGVHYLTKGRSPGQAQKDKPGDPVNHVAANRELGAAFADAMIGLADGPDALAWGTADTNLILRTQADKAVAGRPVTVCWDEVGSHPNTGHGNIDGVFNVDADDPRVRCIAADVLDDREFFLNGDHFYVRTTQRVRLLRT